MLNKRTVSSGLLLSCLICLLTAQPISAYAESCKEVQAVKKPCEGVLLPEEVALQALTDSADALRLRLEVERLQLEVLSTEQMCSADKQYLSAMLVSEESRTKDYSVIIDDLRNDNAKLLLKLNEPTPIYENKWVWASAGTITGMLVIVVAGLLIR